MGKPQIIKEGDLDGRFSLPLACDSSFPKKLTHTLVVNGMKTRSFFEITLGEAGYCRQTLKEALTLYNKPFGE